MSFSGKSLTVFNGEGLYKKAQFPWKVKEIGAKTVFYSGLVLIWDLIFPFGSLWSLAQGGIIANQSYNLYKLYGNAVTKIELLDDGRKVTLYFGKLRARAQTVKISDIRKLEHERTLVETYEEPCLFPLQVGKQTVYINGAGQESILHGELFRAIING